MQTKPYHRYSAAAREAVALLPGSPAWEKSEVLGPPAETRGRGERSGIGRDDSAWDDSPWRDWTCRCLNVLVAVLALPLALPLMALIAVAVKLTSRGPVLYTQKRVGVDRRGQGRDSETDDRRDRDWGGRLFTIYKFRTMYCRDQAEERQMWARPDDPRITPVGRVLRKTRLDELPQLFNVLKGDMNVVGPRPEQPEIFQELRGEVCGYEDRQKVLPGITGWAQVNHHYDQCLEDVKKKVHLDLEYIQRRSPVEDLKILVRTVPVVVAKKGAL